MGSPQHPQHQQSPTRPRTAGPFFSGGADIADIIQQTDDLQDRLAELASEKEQLEAEYTRFPLAGGSLSMRKRKEMVETRLDTVSREISAVKLQLKALHAL
jgi:chaperonin cofactor prefoldin